MLLRVVVVVAAAAAAAAAVAAVGGGVRATELELNGDVKVAARVDFAALDDGSPLPGFAFDPDEVDRRDALTPLGEAGRVCWVHFNDFQRGPVAKQPRLQRALCEAGLRSVKYRGGVTRDISEMSDMADGGPLTPDQGKRQLCAVGPNMVSLVDDRDTTSNVAVPAAGRFGDYVLRTRSAVSQLFVVLGSSPGDVVFTLFRKGDVVATLPYAVEGDNDGSRGLFALTAPQPGGVFDEVRIVGDGFVSGGLATCVGAVGVPCDQVDGFASGNSDGDGDNKADDDDDENDECAAFESDKRKRDVNDVNDVDEALSRTGPREIDVTFDEGAHYNGIVDAALGPMCEVRMATFDQGYAYDQLPDRLSSDSLLEYIDFIGGVQAYDADASRDLSELPEVGDKAFCPMHYNAGGIVARAVDAHLASDEAQVFLPQLSGAEIVIKLRRPTRSAVVQIVKGASDIDMTTAYTLQVRVTLGAQQSEPVNFIEETSGGLLTISALGRGVFNAIVLRSGMITSSFERSGFCVAVVAVPGSDCGR